MTKSRDLANLAGSATGLATDSELSAAVAGIDLTNVQRIVPVDSNISVPGAPTSVSGTVSNAESSVSFVAPTDNGGSTILSYTVISSPGNIKKSGTTSPITITGLTNGTAYTFTVKAHNIAGSSTASTASGSVTPSNAVTVNYLVVAGGGGGGKNYSNNWSRGGGGAGGLRSTVTATGGGGTLESALIMDPSTNYTVTVGAGGAESNNGSNSVFSTITSTGGGAGAFTSGNSDKGANGGSGGGNAAEREPAGGLGGTGTANQGYGGGGAGSGGATAGGGGGGAGAAGVSGGNYIDVSNNAVGGNGGTGIAVSITGSSVTYAGGGGGGAGYSNSNNGVSAGTGGAGGGGAGSYQGSVNGVAGTANRGGGGGGAMGGSNQTSGAGGSGVVILRYLTAQGTITIGAGLTGTTATDGSHKVTTITAGTGNVSWA